MSQPPLKGLKKAFILLVILFLPAAPLFGMTPESEFRADLITIRVSGEAAAREMPDANFFHDKHTDALPNENCSTCHMKKENIFVFKFNRLTDAGYEADKKLYHEKCIGCHQEKRDQGIKSGPLTSECRLCHSQTPAYRNAAQPFGLDKSLHYRHVIAESIPSTGADKDWNCGACHHEFDKELGKTIYVKGTEGTCRYCHKAEKTEDIRSFRTVAHEDCLNCHYLLKADNKKAGPTECAGCHDPDRQAKIEVVTDVPRIQRNQPDSVLLSLWLKEARSSNKPSAQFIRPVAFNHKFHEAENDTCYSCHHASMDACGECHTRMGSEKSKYTRLGTAMHSEESAASCIGCHTTRVQDKNCAGCHSQMHRKSFSETDCTKCHTVAREALDPVPANDEKILKIAESEITAWSAPQSPIADKDIPENVTIGVMKDLYDGATFPHRKIVRALSAGIDESPLAKHFHGDEQSVCAGCHHYSPASLLPPKCASCHGISAAPEPDGRPGLKGAYHIQCIRCHTEMGMEKPAATDCVACHKLKTKSTQLSD